PAHRRVLHRPVPPAERIRRMKSKRRRGKGQEGRARSVLWDGEAPAEPSAGNPGAAGAPTPHSPPLPLFHSSHRCPSPLAPCPSALHLRPSSLAVEVVVAAGALLFVFPVLLIFITSLKPDAEIVHFRGLLPEHATLANFREILQNPEEIPIF